MRVAFFFVLAFLNLAALVSLANDTDGDGLLDVIDVTRPIFNGNAEFQWQRIEDLDGANLLVDLTAFNLSYNKIANIDSGDFVGLDELQTLDLSSNRIIGVEEGDFDGLQNLTTLNLESNRIESIDSGDFRGLGSLQLVDLSANRIRKIDFEELANVRTLYLDRNDFTSIARDDLQGLDNLGTLRLSVEDFEHSNFSHLTNLHTLFLLDSSDEEATSLEPGDLQGLNNLQFLQLQGIKSIERGDFEGLANLQTLDLEGTGIESIEDEGFFGLHSLQTLIMEDPGPGLTRIDREDFAGLTTLRTLSFEDNSVAHIEPGAFRDLTSLTTLNLNSNDIARLETGAFQGLRSLQTLDLTQGNFSELNLSHTTFENLGSCNDDGRDNTGFCIDGDDISSANLNGATLSRGSFLAIMSGADRLEDLSMIGIQFTDEHPSQLLIHLLFQSNTVTVDQVFYDVFADVFDEFETLGNTLDVIEGTGGRLQCDANIVGGCDAHDLELMYSAAGPGTKFDFTGDGVVDESDIAGWLAEASSAENFANANANVFLSGDVNLDGTVNSRDLGLLLNNFGEVAATPDEGPGWVGGDLNMDGSVDSEDLGLLINNFQSTPVTVVPESDAIVLWFLAFMTLFVIRKTR